ncbi:MAG: CbiX/SirB N-terminal domain-containing protein [Albidovulum sp.]
MTRSALIIAHGQPSDPEPAEVDMATFTAKVAEYLPDWQIGSVTLAMPGGLKKALQTYDKPLIFPLFMADGWFIRTLLPKRLAEANGDGLTILTPFGLLPDTLDLAARFAQASTKDAGWAERDTTLILAAHGSGRSPYPSEAAKMTAAAIASQTKFADIRVGFIEEAPYLRDTLRDAGPRAVCLPLFVARWGHVITDIPDALDANRFTGLRLAPLGTHKDVPSMIARAIGTFVG